MKESYERKPVFVEAVKYDGKMRDEKDNPIHDGVEYATERHIDKSIVFAWKAYEGRQMDLERSMRIPFIMDGSQKVYLMPDSYIVYEGTKKYCMSAKDFESMHVKQEAVKHGKEATVEQGDEGVVESTPAESTPKPRKSRGPRRESDTE